MFWVFVMSIVLIIQNMMLAWAIYKVRCEIAEKKTREKGREKREIPIVKVGSGRESKSVM